MENKHPENILHLPEGYADWQSVLEENARRNAALDDSSYDPLSGCGCHGKRIAVEQPGASICHIPAEMTADTCFRTGMNREEFQKLRMRYDFEYWCTTCVTVKDKAGYRDIPLRLNRPQRLILAVLEEMRIGHRPIRAILLKARQCGGSTLVQAYMAWIQLMHRDNWHSLICAHRKDSASIIRGMMTKLFSHYPAQFLPDGVDQLRLRPFEGSRNVCRIEGRGNTVMVCSAESVDAARGADIAMAHLSEVAFWPDTPGRDPEDLVRSVAGTIALADHTLVVMESTANGVGNFFHDEWLRAKAGRSDKQPIFIPWHKSTLYRLPADDYGKLWAESDKYERWLWDEGCSLEQIAWYRAKRREYPTHRAMQAEYPTTDAEAFTATDRQVFPAEGTEHLLSLCRPPLLTGDMAADACSGKEALRNVRFAADPAGLMKVWKLPAKHVLRANRYVTVVDIGGRSAASDWSVIAVIDRGEEPGCRPEIVAQWRGHTDHDLLAWKAAQIAQWYCRALLVVESNTLESERTEGNNSAYILDEIADSYRNLYHREGIDRETGRAVTHPGFHTNRSTKPLIVNRHIAAVRDHRYTERDTDAVGEHIAYERRADGSFGAKAGHHDDILMTRCIGLFIIEEMDRHAAADTAPLRRQ